MISELPAESRDHLESRLSSFVDTKLLLGYRYNDRVFGAPSMEDANAIQGQAANEFGQANHFMTALADFGVDDEEYLARSTPEVYRNASVLDEDPGPWPAFLATVGFADMATQVRLTSLADSEWTAVAEPAGKAVQEEEFHTQYLIGAVKSYVDDDAGMTRTFGEALSAVLPPILRWFGPDTDVSDALLDRGVLGHSPDEERRLYLSRVGGFVDEHFDGDLGVDVDADERSADIDWGDWDDDRCRLDGGGPDAEAVDALAAGGIDAAIGGVSP
ncbi:MAG: Phenylacetic acid catabolic protein [Salinigranum sp.]